jgi:magnesium transporter
MIHTHTYKKNTWIDIEGGTDAELDALAVQYDFPELIRQEIPAQEIRSRVDVFPHLLFMVLYFPLPNGEEQEVDFVIGKDFLITAHGDSIPVLESIKKNFEKSLHHYTDMHAGYIAYTILRELYLDTIDKLDDLIPVLKKIEHKIFEGDQEAMVHELSHVNRKVLDARGALRFHHNVLSSFEHAGSEFFGAEFDYYLSSLTGEFNKIQILLDSHRDIIRDLRDTNDALLNAKTNSAIKGLTILNSLLLPLSIIVGFFGMNTTNELLFITTPYKYAIVVFGMLGTGIGHYYFFQKKKWV